MKNNICAVVVTYNRIKLLKECIDSLRKQTKNLDGIIVVNNNSNDGTKEWLALQNDISALHQENLGGAGGFFNGINSAYNKGYNWIWCMDDDCLPETDALEKLFCTEYKTNVLLNSVVVDKTNPKNLTFGLNDAVNKKFYKYYDEIKNINLINTANLFNGTLIHKNAIENVGLPNPKFFIYGDDYEYFLRIKKSNTAIFTVTASVVKHPLQRHIYFGKWKFFYRINHFNLLGVKYFPRNISAIWYFYEEFTFRRLLKTYFYDLIGILIIQKNISFFIQYIYSISKAPAFIKELKTGNNSLG